MSESALATAVRKARTNFNPDQPRGRDGRWIRIGAFVHVKGVGAAWVDDINGPNDIKVIPQGQGLDPKPKKVKAKDIVTADARSRPLRDGDQVFAISQQFSREADDQPLELPGHVWNVHPEGLHGEGVPVAEVRLELDDTHPAYQDVLNDMGPVAAEQAEFVDYVPLTDITHPDGAPVDIQRLQAEEREKKRAIDEQAARDRIDEIRASGERLALPELDAGLRTAASPVDLPDEPMPDDVIELSADGSKSPVVSRGMDSTDIFKQGVNQARAAVTGAPAAIDEALDKARKGFDPKQPRGKDGRWIHIGDWVELPDGTTAQVVGNDDSSDGVEVKLDPDSNETKTFDASELKQAGEPGSPPSNSGGGFDWTKHDSGDMEIERPDGGPTAKITEDEHDPDRPWSAYVFADAETSDYDEKQFDSPAEAQKWAESKISDHESKGGGGPAADDFSGSGEREPAVGDRVKFTVSEGPGAEVENKTGTIEHIEGGVASIQDDDSDEVFGIPTDHEDLEPIDPANDPEVRGQGDPEAADPGEPNDVGENDSPAGSPDPKTIGKLAEAKAELDQALSAFDAGVEHPEAKEYVEELTTPLKAMNPEDTGDIKRALIRSRVLDRFVAQEGGNSADAKAIARAVAKLAKLAGVDR